MSKIRDQFIAEALNRGDSWQLYVQRKGGFGLSLVAGKGLYSTPREFTSKNRYKRVEVAIIGPKGRLVRPEAAGLSESLCDLFETGIESPVAAYITWDQAQALVDALS